MCPHPSMPFNLVSVRRVWSWNRAPCTVRVHLFAFFTRCGLKRPKFKTAHSWSRRTIAHTNILKLINRFRADTRATLIEVSNYAWAHASRWRGILARLTIGRIGCSRTLELIAIAVQSTGINGTRCTDRIGSFAHDCHRQYIFIHT